MNAHGTGRLLGTALLFLPLLCAACCPFAQGRREKVDIDIEHGGLTLNPFIGYTQLKGVRVTNPLGFDDRILVLFPEIYVNYDERGFMEGGVAHFSRVRVDIAEVQVVRNKKGEFNFEPILERITPSGKKKKAAFRIDRLRLKIGRIIYKDYTAGAGKKPLIVTLDARFDRTYRDVTDGSALVSSVGNVLLDTVDLASVANFSLLEVPSVVVSAWEALSEITKSRLFGGGPEQEQRIREKGRQIYERAQKKGVQGQ